MGFHQVELDNLVQGVVGRQGVLVLLVGPQFGGGGFVDDAPGDELPGPVQEMRQFVHHGLGHIPQDAQPAAHVAVQGAVAHGQLALVAGGQHQVSEAVGQGHEDVAPDAGLDVFQGDLHPVHRHVLPQASR